MEKSFFEYIGLADKEKVHSQIFAWLISKDCQAIANDCKVTFINSLFGLNIKEITTIETEKKNADIVITTDCGLIVIENKIKSSQHSNQLDKYVNDYNEKKDTFIFLTLIREYCNKPWKNVLYSTYFTLLNEVKLIENKDSIILKEYIVYLKNLTEVTKAFLDEPSKFEIVFNKKDEFHGNNDRYSPYYSFIINNKLKTILQKAFLTKVFKSNIKHEMLIEETHGKALINFIINKEIIINNTVFKTIIQFQDGSIKFAFHKFENNKVKNDIDSSKRYDGFKKAFEELKSEFSPNQYEINPRKKSENKDVTEYISLSIFKIINYWKMDAEELTNEIITHIKTGEILSKKLEELLSNKK